MWRMTTSGTIEAASLKKQDRRILRQENAVTPHSAGLWRSLPAFAGFVEAVMAPTAILVITPITDRSGIAGSLSVLDLYPPDNFGLQAEWFDLIRVCGIRDVHNDFLIDRFAY